MAGDRCASSRRAASSSSDSVPRASASKRRSRSPATCRMAPSRRSVSFFNRSSLGCTRVLLDFYQDLISNLLEDAKEAAPPVVDLCRHHLDEGAYLLHRAILDDEQPEHEAAE